MTQPTKEQFLKDVENHQMSIINDAGLCRHILFSKPESNTHYFQLTTWPNHLCISGDMGTYVFERNKDMFCFFRLNELEVNVGYWAEKLTSNSRYKGYNEFSEDAVEACIDDYIADYLDENPEYEDIKSQIKEEILEQVDTENEFTVHRSLSDFSGIDCCDIELRDTWEYRFTKPTYQYTWCLYAIVWGIQQYDKLKEQSHE